MPYASLTSTPGSDEWFEAAIAGANRRRWRQLLGASGAALSASLLLLVGGASSPTATQQVEVVEPPPSPSQIPGRYRAEDPPGAVPLPTGGTAPARRPVQSAKPRPAPAATPAAPGPAKRMPSPFTSVVRSSSGGYACWSLDGWCGQIRQPPVQSGARVPMVMTVCGGALASALQFDTDLEVEFIVENTKRQRIDAYSAHFPATYGPHSLSRGKTTGSCYSWQTSWDGYRPDGTRVPGAYVLRVRAMSKSNVTSRELTHRFDLK